LFYTNPAHDIHHTGNLLFPDIISYYKLENGKQGGFRRKYNHIFDSTAAYGDTVFWKWGSEQISDFDRHYKALLKEK